ncbi:SMI1/KNR4 family protein [Amycolatopsis regifaucium]|uniref:Glucan synthase n=1 Tax=Amycolatopsis regifaucium TaxID=546365 RepID=A0A154MN68_9PSEU|nr:SMI1/KNR4 family protein [Amycolatopsis regifaucium]KZB85772.1 glucan synthase [Amycolatopsis regifaucium]OKA10473.1 glucan synthase [Amycolatopsis regifaucium]SFI78562.1 SMI1 / KNR4 family (SUKH-1) [Amycolatopsis regifaucium]
MRKSWGRAVVVAVASVVIVSGLVFAVTARGGQGRGAQWLSAEQAPRTTPRAQSYSTAAPAPTTRPTLTVDSGCRLGQGPAELTPVPEATTRRVNAAWDRVERWLAANAPTTAAALRPAATIARIAETQRKAGVALPAELVAFLLRHDGVSGLGESFALPPFHRLASTETVADEAKVLCEVLLSSGSDDSVGSWWHGQFVPVAVNGGGDGLFLDQRAGTGRLGSWDHEGSVRFEGWPGTLTELLEQTAAALETGGTVLDGYRPVVTGNRALDWDFPR